MKNIYKIYSIIFLYFFYTNTFYYTPSAKEKLGNDLVYFASKGYQDKIIDYINNKKVDINSKSSEHKFSSLVCAAKLNSFNITKLLLAYPKLNINSIDRFGNSALMIACIYGYTDIAKMLINDPRIYINLEDFDGDTALSIACKCGQTKIVENLLKHPKIRINIEDINGLTAIDKALSEFHEDIINLLLKRPEIIYKKNKVEKFFLYLNSKKIANLKEPKIKLKIE